MFWHIVSYSFTSTAATPNLSEFSARDRSLEADVNCSRLTEWQPVSLPVALSLSLAKALAWIDPVF